MIASAKRTKARKKQGVNTNVKSALTKAWCNLTIIITTRLKRVSSEYTV